MSYRNITVNGETYKYVIGRAFTKVNGIGCIANDILGVEVGHEKSLVTPADVRRFILGNGTVDPHFHDGPHICGCGKTGDDVTLRAWPYDYEIYGKLCYAYMCDDCEEKNSWDI